MLYCLVASKHLISSETILHRPTLHLDQYLTYTDDNQ